MRGKLTLACGFLSTMVDGIHLWAGGSGGFIQRFATQFPRGRCVRYQ